MHHPGRQCFVTRARHGKAFDVGFGNASARSRQGTCEKCMHTKQPPGAGGVTAKDWCGFTRPG
jgi:hypothetical protein